MSPTNALRDALEQIKRDCGKVCPDFATCEHEACRSSYTAWAIAERALEAVPVDLEPAREIQRRECIACGSPIEQFRAPKSRGIVTVIGCRNGCGFVLDREGTRRPYDEVSQLATYREVRPAEPEAWEYGIDHVGLGSGLLVGYRNIGAVRRWLADVQCSGQIVRREPAKPPGPWERVDLRARLCPMSGDECPREGPTHSDGSPFGPCDECDGRPQDGGER